VLEEDAARVFEITHVNRYAAHFMTITCGVRPEWRARIPAVVHVDGTARPQIVRDEDNPLFAAILRRFRDQTELPVLINTSFQRARRADRQSAGGVPAGVAGWAGRFRRDAAGGVCESVRHAPLSLSP
jgi:hypothetical protein